MPGFADCRFADRWARAAGWLARLALIGASLSFVACADVAAEPSPVNGTVVERVSQRGDDSAIKQAQPAPVTPAAAADRNLSVAASRGLVTIGPGPTLLRDCVPWFPRGISLFGRLIPADWKAEGETASARREFGPQMIDLIKSLGADVVRYQIGMPFLDPKSPHFKPGYLDEVRDATALARRSGLTVILSMQWQKRTGVPAVEMQPKSSALRAWQHIGPVFANDLGVVYELFNEPVSVVNPGPPAWEIWRAGHQAIIDELRRAGVRNVLLVNGLRAGTILQGSPKLNDPINQLGFAIHPRLAEYLDSEPEWDERFGRFADRHVVVATEWSHPLELCEKAGGEHVEQLLGYLERKRIGLIGYGVDSPSAKILKRIDGKAVLTTFANQSCNAPNGGPGESIKKLFDRNATPRAAPVPRQVCGLP